MNQILFRRFPVAGIDPMSATTARSFPRHTHDQFGVGIIDSGGHASWSGRGAVEAGPGHFISVNPGEVHDGRAIGHPERSWRILYFDPGLMQEMNTEIHDGARADFMFEQPVFADALLHRLFDKAFAFAYATTTRDPGREMASETAILKLIARLGVHSTSQSKRDERSDLNIRRAKDRIDDDPAATLTLKALAAEAGLSRYQLIRGFARSLSLTPHAYILQRRICLARRLIRAGHPLAEVAADAGFYDQSHLNRCFVRQFGVTPKRYAYRSR